MAYLEKIYSKSKADGHFNKFDSYDAFVAYFKDENSYKKLWDFLKAKGYKVPAFNEFLRKVKEEPENHPQPQEDTQSQNSGLFSGIPLPAYGELCILDENLRKFPDILKLGSIKYGALELPLMIPSYGTKGFALITSDDKQKELAAKAIELLAFRVLLSLPDGKCKLFIIDPEKNGQSFAHLYGLDPRILERDVWDDASEISNGLQGLKNSIPRIQAELLTTKYKDLNEYNSQVKHSRQPFQFLLIANFPTNFTSDSLQHLSGILKNGAKAGIYCIMSFDLSKSLPSNDGFKWDDFRNVAVEYSFSDNRIANIDDENLLNSTFYIASIDHRVPANIETLKDELNKALDKSLEVKPETIRDNELWTKSAANGIVVPIGKTEDDRTINFQLGGGSDVYHALIGGAIGKGKSVLLHNIILNIAKLYSPDEVQLYLMDFKQGVEFNTYRTLPHLKLLTISKDIEFGISVLEDLVAQIEIRGELFNDSGVKDLSNYKKITGKSLPRLLLIMDEFQVLLDPKKRASSRASYLLEKVAREGRSFGINILLATQTLADVDLSSSTRSQLGLRIALSMSEQDCLTFLGADNSVPSEFTKAGRAIYNAKHGKKDGNVVFTVSFIQHEGIPDEIQNLIIKTQKNNQSASIKPFIFDGKQSFTYERSESVIARAPNEKFMDIFIGAPFYYSLKDVYYRLRRQEESNLLLLGDDPEAAISIVRQSINQIAFQSHEDTQYYIFDMFPVDSDLQGKFADLTLNGIQNITIIDESKKISECLKKITNELNNRIDDKPSKGKVILCIMSFHTIRDFRKIEYEDNTQLTDLLHIIKDGPAKGIHTILHTLSRKTLEEKFPYGSMNEFENKILLKGQNLSEYNINSIDHDAIEKSHAYIIHPRSRYEADKFKVYK